MPFLFSCQSKSAKDILQYHYTLGTGLGAWYPPRAKISYNIL